jgi:methylated-DNA-[protein]-cysteine S-methyltransferase
MSKHDRYHGIVAAPWGALGYLVRDGALASIDFLPPRSVARPARDALGKRIEAQLRRFFKDPSAGFDIPLQPEGTAYQRRVWAALQRIAPGERLTYGALAHRLRSGPRAVGGACRANPIPLVIPCHRVVSAQGLGGYCGAPTARMQRVKQWLLAHEAGLAPGSGVPD